VAIYSFADKLIFLEPPAPNQSVSDIVVLSSYKFDVHVTAYRDKFYNKTNWLH